MKMDAGVFSRNLQSEEENAKIAGEVLSSLASRCATIQQSLAVLKMVSDHLPHFHSLEDALSGRPT